MRHAGASAARVHVTLVDAGLEIEVTDDGRGGDLVAAGHGLQGMAERATALGGRMLAEGLSNLEIANTLHLSPLTAKTHVSRILAKLGARDRVQLVVMAYQTGLVSPRPPQREGER
jgi:glucose-6-phosphate-specific signal transduction histidine kinase